VPAMQEPTSAPPSDRVVFAFMRELDVAAAGDQVGATMTRRLVALVLAAPLVSAAAFAAQPIAPTRADAWVQPTDPQCGGPNKPDEGPKPPKEPPKT
jgi:hypothetical protein